MLAEIGAEKESADGIEREGAACGGEHGYGWLFAGQLNRLLGGGLGRGLVHHGATAQRKILDGIHAEAVGCDL